jgi:hypothetical protein
VLEIIQNCMVLFWTYSVFGSGVPEVMNIIVSCCSGIGHIEKRRSLGNKVLLVLRCLEI